MRSDVRPLDGWCRCRAATGIRERIDKMETQLWRLYTD